MLFDVRTVSWWSKGFDHIYIKSKFAEEENCCFRNIQRDFISVVFKSFLSGPILQDIEVLFSLRNRNLSQMSFMFHSVKIGRFWGYFFSEFLSNQSPYY